MMENTKRKKHNDVALLEVISKLKPQHFAVLEPYLKDSAIDILSGLLNFLLSNPKAAKFGRKRKKIAELVNSNRTLFDKIAGNKTSGIKVKQKRKIISGSGFPIIPILTAVIPSIVSAIAARR